MSTFKSEWQYRKHVKTHNQSKHACFNCDKQFASRVLLNRHLKVQCAHLPIEDMSHIMDQALSQFNIEFHLH